MIALAPLKESYDARGFHFTFSSASARTLLDVVPQGSPVVRDPWGISQVIPRPSLSTRCR